MRIPENKRTNENHTGRPSGHWPVAGTRKVKLESPNSDGLRLFSSIIDHVKGTRKDVRNMKVSYETF